MNKGERMVAASLCVDAQSLVPVAAARRSCRPTALELRVLNTPEPNLTVGMHWLMSTVATRYNRFRRERGHLFQGRYQALPIEDTGVMGHVVDYVHFKPVRAQVVSAAQVGAFRWRSRSRFLREARWREHLGQQLHEPRTANFRPVLRKWSPQMPNQPLPNGIHSRHAH